jgi:hypothetical protein
MEGTTMHCRSCGTKLETKDTFCSNCGAKVEPFVIGPTISKEDANRIADAQAAMVGNSILAGFGGLIAGGAVFFLCILAVALLDMEMSQPLAIAILVASVGSGIWAIVRLDAWLKVNAR